PHSDAPTLGQHQETVVQSGAVAVLFIGKRVVPIGSLEAREAGLLARRLTPKEILVSTVKAREHILQDVALDSGVFRECRTNVFQLRLLLAACRPPALSPSPPRNALLQGAIVERAATPHDTRQFPLLIGSGLKLEFHCLAHSGCIQMTLFCLLADKTALKRDWWLKPRNASPPGLNPSGLRRAKAHFGQWRDAPPCAPHRGSRRAAR